MNIDDYEEQIVSLGFTVKSRPSKAIGRWLLHCHKHNVDFEKPIWNFPHSLIGCKKCVSEHISLKRTGQKSSNRTTSAQWKEQIRSKHPHIKVLSTVEGFRNPVRLLCATCGHRWVSNVSNLTHSVVGCPECGKRRAWRKNAKSNESFVREIKKEYKGAIEVVGTYINDNTAVNLKCTSCGHEFENTPKVLLLQKRQGEKTTRVACPTCRRAQGPVSGVSQMWLKEVERRKRIKLQYAENGAEKQIRVGKTLYKVDGFHARTNTIYEFYGDAWHGNPSVYASRYASHPRMRNSKRRSAKAGTLLSKTGKRQLALASAGYRVIYVWESDYRNGKLFSGMTTPHV